MQSIMHKEFPQKSPDYAQGSTLHFDDVTVLQLAPENVCGVCVISPSLVKRRMVLMVPANEVVVVVEF